MMSIDGATGDHNLIPLRVESRNERDIISYSVVEPVVLNNLSEAAEWALRIVCSHPEFIPEHAYPWLPRALKALSVHYKNYHNQYDEQYDFENMLMELSWQHATHMLVALQVLSDLVHSRHLTEMDYFCYSDGLEEDNEKRYRFQSNAEIRFHHYPELDEFIYKKYFKTKMTQNIYGRLLVNCVVPPGESMALQIEDRKFEHTEGDRFTVRIQRGFLTQQSWADGDSYCFFPYCKNKKFLRTYSLNPIFYCEILKKRCHGEGVEKESFSEGFKVMAEVPFHWMSDETVDRSLYEMTEDEILLACRRIMGMM